ncbi:MAG: cytochrome c family protein [Kiloniellales bacterium]
MKALFATVGLAGVLALAAPSLAEEAAWTLVPDESTVAYGSIKKNTVGEVNHFTKLSGQASADGKVEVAIDLTSVETWIDIRNERMIKMVFGEDATTATVTAQVDMAGLQALPVGGAMITDVVGKLAFLGKSLDIDTPLFVARLGEDKVLVTTAEMIMISTADLGVSSGIDALQEVAKLPGITRVVPVTLRFVFQSSGAAGATAVAQSETAQSETAPTETAAAIDGDPAKGKRVWNKCRACHVLDKPQNRVGPHLVGIIGRESGSVEGYRYSKANADSDVVWTPEVLTAYLADPKAFMPGTKMVFPGLKKPEDIANLLAYIQSVQQ